MAGILDYFLTPQNVERGMNLLQGNQGIVNALTGLPIGPASGRAYIRSLSGWRLAKGGVVDKSLSGRSRDI